MGMVRTLAQFQLSTEASVDNEPELEKQPLQIKVEYADVDGELQKLVTLSGVMAVRCDFQHLTPAENRSRLERLTRHLTWSSGRLDAIHWAFEAHQFLMELYFRLEFEDVFKAGEKLDPEVNRIQLRSDVEDLVNGVTWMLIEFGKALDLPIEPAQLFPSWHNFRETYSGLKRIKATSFVYSTSRVEELRELDENRRELEEYGRYLDGRPQGSRGRKERGPRMRRADTALDRLQLPSGYTNKTT